MGLWALRAQHPRIAWAMGLSTSPLSPTVHSVMGLGSRFSSVLDACLGAGISFWKLGMGESLTVRALLGRPWS